MEKEAIDMIKDQRVLFERNFRLPGARPRNIKIYHGLGDNTLIEVWATGIWSMDYSQEVKLGAFQARTGGAYYDAITKAITTAIRRAVENMQAERALRLAVVKAGSELASGELDVLAGHDERGRFTGVEGASS